MSRQQYQSSNPSPRPEDGDSNEPLEDDIPPRPKRPLTVFNLFGKLERNFIVQSSQKQIRSEFGNTEGNIFENVDPTAVDPYLELRPEKYRGITLPYDWFKAGKNKTKRQHHQNHGVIDFKNLSKLVSKRWNAADEETKQFCKTVYDKELVKYYEEKKGYIEVYGKAAFDSQKSVYKKRSSEDDVSASTSSDSFKKPAAKRGSGASSSSQSNQLGYACVANWQMNPYASQMGNAPIHGDAFYAASHHSNQLHNSLYPICNAHTNTGGSGYNAMQHYAHVSSYNPFASYYQVNQPSETAFPIGHAGSLYTNAPSFYSNNGHFENQITFPAVQITTQEWPYQCYYAALPDELHLGHSTVNELSRELDQFHGNQSPTVHPMHPLQNSTNLEQQFQQPSLEQPYFVNPTMHSPMTTAEIFEDADRQVVTKPDGTNIEGNIFRSDSNVSLALVGNDICNILCGEELENVFDSDLEAGKNDAVLTHNNPVG